MKLLERTDEDRESQAGDPSTGDSGENLGRMRLAGQGLIAAGGDAIRKALSGNSQSFLAATRQQGGQ
jgi:hypothetical protein